ALVPVAAGAAPQRAATPSDAPVLHKIADDPSTTTTTSSPRTSTVAPAEVVVAAGDHLWGIAERTLEQRLGRAPNDAEIAPYWSKLIEANRDRLTTGDPDLIFAGQVFRLPS
ncbi:MAG: resuscitation-promoting factor RpfA, partial [Actinomycetota bacterium]|nr:resuscitation-promoting factor RpfA [Actinomycetota bacterium]